MALINITIDRGPRTGKNKTGRRALVLVAAGAVAYAAVGGIASATAPSAVSTPQGVYVAMTPTPIGGAASIAAGAKLTKQVAGVDGIPADATAVALQLTVTDGIAGSLSVYGLDTKQPADPQLQWSTAQTLTGTATPVVGSNERITLLNKTGTATVQVDAIGYYVTTPLPSVYNEVGSGNIALTPAGSIITVATITVPSGIYDVTGSTTIAANGATARDDVACFIRTPSGSPDGGYSDLNPTTGQTEISVQAVIATSGESITLGCVDGDAISEVYFPTITALQVGTVTGTTSNIAHVNKKLNAKAGS